MHIYLVEVFDRHFAAMIAGGETVAGLRLPPGGVEAHEVLVMLRALAAEVRAHRGPASWMIVADDMVVGLCSYKHLPGAGGAVEFGYGIAESCRGQGLGTAAVAALVRMATRDPSVRILTALTAPNNLASQRVLEHCGFERVGTQIDPEDGLVCAWQKATHGTRATPLADLAFRLRYAVRGRGVRGTQP